MRRIFSLSNDRWLFLFLAFICYILAITGFFEYFKSASYVETIGRVCNLESTTHHGRYTVTLYDYDIEYIQWTTDGETHVKHFDAQILPKKEGQIVVYYSRDGKDMVTARFRHAGWDFVELALGTLFAIVTLITNKKYKMLIKDETILEKADRLKKEKTDCLIILISSAVFIPFLPFIYGTGDYDCLVICAIIGFVFLASCLEFVRIKMEMKPLGDLYI